MIAREYQFTGDASRLPLPGAEPHVWRVSLCGHTGTEAAAHALLSADERERAARFHFDRHRRRYAICRAALRQILAGYTGLPAAEIDFSYTAHGKPYLESARIAFNVSHSGDLALVAVAAAGEVGVDVEQMRPGIEREGIERYFSPHEAQVLRGLPPGLQNRAFYNCWTRKEAYLKATGKGLSGRLLDFDVSLAPGEPAALLAHRTHPGEPARWHLEDVEAGAGHAAAVVFEILPLTR